MAYWSSVTQRRTRKLSLMVLTDDSVFVSCMMMERYSRKVTSKLLGTVAAEVVVVARAADCGLGGNSIGSKICPRVKYRVSLPIMQRGFSEKF